MHNLVLTADFLCGGIGLLVAGTGALVSESSALTIRCEV